MILCLETIGQMKSRLTGFCIRTEQELKSIGFF